MKTEDLFVAVVSVTTLFALLVALAAWLLA